MARTLHRIARAAFGRLPRDWRFELTRRLITIEPEPDPRLELRIASTQDELEACFGLLHDAYVGQGYMQPDPSGLRVTAWHALPTTTTILAAWDGAIVGTLSLIREGVFGFPLQSIFDLTPLRDQPGHIAEVSALAVHPAFRRTGGQVLFPLMKFMYEYCTGYFDTRHLVIAVNPNMIELYEALLLFRRLQASVVESYGFANGAPAVGATLDLASAPARFERLYAGRSPRKDLHRYFVDTPLAQLKLPPRPIYTTNDAVMTPALLDHFFNRRSRVFEKLDLRQRVLLHAIYADERYREVLPPLSAGETTAPRRAHPRHSIKCPALLSLAGERVAAMVIEMSRHGLQALVDRPLPEGTRGRLEAQLGTALRSTVDVRVVRRVPAETGLHYGLHVDAPDAAWLECVRRLESSQTHAELADGGFSATAAA